MRNEQSRPELLLSTEQSDFAAAERGEHDVGDGALDVPFRETARFEFITMLCRRAVWRILCRSPEDVIG
jgi:hypothetical protein